MKRLFTFLLSLSLFILWTLGCTSYQTIWKKDGGTNEEFHRLRYDCLREAQQRVSYSEVNKNQGILAGQSESSVKTNELLFTSCMNAKGWFLVKVSTDQAGQPTPPATPPPNPQQVYQPPEKHQTDQSETESTANAPKVEARVPDSTYKLMRVDGHKVKFREGPSTKAKILKTLDLGTKVKVIKQNKDWFFVEIPEGHTGWCHESVLKSM